MYAGNLSSQTYSRLTTDELLNRVVTNGADFINHYPDIRLNYTLPLIDTTVAIELARLLGQERLIGLTTAIGLQLKDDSLKQMFLNNILEHDTTCNAEAVSTNKFYEVASTYSYGYLAEVMLNQLEKNDSNFLQTALKEFEFWAPLAAGYFDTIPKSGFRQFAIKSGRKKFSPCLLASPGNCSLWVSCIYLITGKEEYGSANEQFNHVYKKFMTAFRVEKKIDNRKDLVRFGKKEIITFDKTQTALDSLDFESIPAIKEKFDKCRKGDEWQIKIYTHGTKALLLLYEGERMRIGFSKQMVGYSSIYLAELNSPSTIQLTKVNYRERYL